MNFAEGYGRNKQGWILFPTDREFRRSIFFPEEVMQHPAKMNLWLQKAMIDYVAKPGETILDPFGGTGSLMIAAMEGIRVILIELEDGYHQLQQRAMAQLEKSLPESAGLVTLIQGDNRLILPIPVNHIMTSPPYAQAMNISHVRVVDESQYDDSEESQDKLKSKRERQEKDRQMLEYSKSAQNISKLNTFLYNQNMEKIYKLCYQSLPSGGTLTVNIKDRINNNQRVYLGKWVETVCLRIGFQPPEWYKFFAQGTSYTRDRISKGLETVQDEDVIVFRKA